MFLCFSSSSSAYADRNIIGMRCRARNRLNNSTPPSGGLVLSRSARSASALPSAARSKPKIFCCLAVDGPWQHNIERLMICGRGWGDVFIFAIDASPTIERRAHCAPDGCRSALLGRLIRPALLGGNFAFSSRNRRACSSSKVMKRGTD